jgi:hypothetical protein
MLKITKKGAMFGLDARIALAIFGALSVISGAALYSAIEESKLVKLRTSFSEWAKATEAYMLDEGADLPFIPAANYTSDVTSLVTKPASATNWNGPYLNYEPITYSAQVKVLKVPEYKTEFIIFRYSDGPPAPDHVSGFCTAGTRCFHWVCIGRNPGPVSVTDAQKFDTRFDDGVHTTGKVRFYKGTYVTPGTATLCVQGPKLFKQVK